MCPKRTDPRKDLAMTLETRTVATDSAVLPSNLGAARTWGAGGETYDLVSRGIADAIAHAVDRLDPQPEEKILDVATGTGWAARLIAERGAAVTGVDLGTEVIEAARMLSNGHRIDFQVGDAEALPFPDDHFDAVISTFGVMFAQNPEAAAAELARVVRPGGRLVLANWATEGSVQQMFQLIKSYKPEEDDPPPSPFEWGKTARVMELLGDDFSLRFEEATSFFRPSSSAKAWKTFSTGFGPVVTLLKTLPTEQAERLEREFIAFHEAHRSDAGILMQRPYVITVGNKALSQARAS